ncbi:MAG: hypothetical protein ABSB41_16690 [Anaerolineales bacterium]|jgi:hypothetical protein
MNELIGRLFSEPALRYKLAVTVCGASPDSTEAQDAVHDVLNAKLVWGLLSERGADGRIPYHPYKKWNGAHWVLSLLADLGYPALPDSPLAPLMEDSYGWLLGQSHAQYIRAIQGRVRRCASQEGYAVWYSLRLGLADGRTQELVERLMKWQWPDGGWNCDKRPEADTSSFMETLIPLRALALYAQVSGEVRARLSAERAAEVFLTRQLYQRRRDGQLIDPHFVRLHYPCYWHYDILFGLKVMAESGFLGDPRCAAALDLMESKRLSQGGFPAEESYTRLTRPALSGYSLVSWGGTSKRRMNPFVTADALYVLRLAGRFHPVSSPGL